MQEKQRAETEKRSSALLGYFLAGIAILLVPSACGAPTGQEPTRHELVTLKGHAGIVFSVAFSSDGKTLVYKRTFFFGGGGAVLFPLETYAAVKGYFDQVHKQDNHNIALKQVAASN